MSERLTPLRITPVRQRRAADIFCPTCGQFHEPTLHAPTRDVLGLTDPAPKPLAQEATPIGPATPPPAKG